MSDLFPETRISRDALEALQLERLRATLRTPTPTRHRIAPSARRQACIRPT